MDEMKKIYLDYAATTSVHTDVFRSMEPYFTVKFGNPGSLHSFGQEAIAEVDASRETIAKAMGAGFREVIFTGSATEANNLALRGIARSGSRVIVSSIEHESILETAQALEKNGIDVVYLPVDMVGVVDLDKLKSSLNKKTVLVSVMYANNETGTIQPIEEISRIIKDFDNKILFHTDAVQAFQFLDCDVKKLGADLMTLSAHKIYGPKGIGILYVSKTAKKILQPIITGGGQEYGMRSGTENVASIVGFAKAVELVVGSRAMPAGRQELESERIRELRDYFWSELKKIHPSVELNGSLENSLPNILNIYFPGHKSEDILIGLDMAGIAVSSGSACSMRSSKLSHVLRAFGLLVERIQGSVRFSFGRPTSKEEIEKAIDTIRKIIKN